MEWLLQSVWLVPLYPLFAFLLIALGRAFPQPLREDQSNPPLLASKQAAMGLTVGATALGLVHALAAVAWLLAGSSSSHGALVPMEQNWTWLSVGPLTFKLGTLLDAPAVMMLLVVTFVSLLIQIYTHGYMDHDKGYAKFFGYLALFNFSMLGLVLSTNLVQMYIFWELVGVSSYLLIGFWFHKPAAAAASLKAFLMNRVGDFGFLVGILLLLLLSFGWWGSYLGAHPEQALLSFQGFRELAPALVGSMPADAGWLLLTMAVLLFMGPMAKSAQVPLHTWLPDAMEGPTPISALIHAATMVAAGVFLVGRLFPILEAIPGALTFILWIGVITAVVGASIALVQQDIKKALAYSTMSQLGFMMASMGLGAYTAALFHLFTHAFFKAMLFLCSGSVIHACEDEQDMRKMGGLFGQLPLTAWTYLIGTVAISGLFWTSGYWSKDEILLAAQQNHPVVYTILAATAGLTAFYMFRTFFLTFTGAYRGEAHVHQESPVMVWPLVVLAVPSALIGLVLSGVFPGLPTFAGLLPTPTSADALHHATAVGHAVGHGSGLGLLFTPVGLTSQAIGLAGLLLAFLFYGKPGLPRQWVKRLLPGTHALLTNRWYVDDIYQGLVEGGYLFVANASAAIDRYLVDGLVNGVAQGVSGTGAALRYLQSGRVQTYLALLGVSLVAFVLLVALL